VECIVETKACTILEFLQGLQGSLSVTFEEGTSAAWLHDLLKPHVSHLVVCDPTACCSCDLGGARPMVARFPGPMRMATIGVRIPQAVVCASTIGEK
jgi:hypothetical protein